MGQLCVSLIALRTECALCDDAALIQSCPIFDGAVWTEMETGRVSYAQVYQWHQELQRALYAGTDDAKEDEQTVIGINLVPYSIEETATMLLVVEQRRWMYVALDVQLSLARQLALLQRSGARRLVTSVDSPLATFVVNRFAGERVKTQVVGDKTSPFLPVQVVTLPSKYFQIEVEQTGRGAGGRRKDDIQVDAPLYVLYTSGTTGKEKRVLGSRKGAWTRLEWMWKIYPFTTLKTGRSSERVLRATRLSFVDSVWEILGAFLQRVPLVHLQPPRHRVKSTSFSYMTSVVLDNSPRFLKVVCNEGVTRFTAVPSVLDVLLLQTTENERKSCLNGLRYVLSSGESLPFHVVRRLTASLPNVTILNLYGSTELSGDVTCMEFNARSLPTQVAARERDDVPIATLDERGIVGGGETSLVLVSEDQKNDIRHSGNGSATLIWPRNHSSEIEGTTRTGKQPVSGVLYVSGPLLTDEYAGDIQGNMFPDLASISGRRTENDPARNENPSWWFRTGDICSVVHRYIYFDGRKDSAVKTRGHLVHMDAVERAVALALKETTEDAQIDSTGGIVAFPVPKKVSKHGLLITSIMAFVLYEDTGSTGIVQYSQTKKLNAWIAEHHGTAHIPHKVFMVPAKVVPRFANGKIDRKSLKGFFEYVIDQRDTLTLYPRINSVMISPAQTLVANLLNEILGIPSSDDVYDDIWSRTFGELGGNSLLATLFVHELRQQFGALSLTARELLEMRIEEIVSVCSTTSREAERIDCQVRTTSQISGLNTESASNIAYCFKRRKKLPNDCSGVCPGGECNSNTHQTSRLTCVSRYNRSSTSVDGICLPVCYTSPTSMARGINPGSSSSCLPWSLRRVWQVDLGKCIDASPLVVQRHDHKGSVCSTWAVIGSHSGHIVCVDVLAAGREIWRVTLDDRIEACAAISVRHELVYIGTYAGSFFALHLHSGATRWRFQAKGTIKASAVVMDDQQLVVCGAYNGKLYGLDAVTGQKQWAVDLCGTIFSTPLYCAWSEQLFSATTNGAVVALQTGLGRPETQWKLELPAPVFAGLNADRGFEMLIVGCADGRLYGVSMSEGDIRWQAMTDKPIFSSPCVYRPGSIVFGSHDGMLRKVNCSDGRLAWTTDLHSAVFASPAVVRLLSASATTNQSDSKDDEHLLCCVTTTAGLLYICDEATGSILYETCALTGNALEDVTSDHEGGGLLGPLFGSPVIVDNWCLLGTRTNQFYGFKLVGRRSEATDVLSCTKRL